MPVDLSRLPWPSETWKYVLGIAASLLVLVGVGFGIYKAFSNRENPYTDSELYTMYNTSIVMLVGQYHYEVTAGNLNPDVLRSAGIPSKFQWDGERLIPEGHSQYGEIISFATGFFVSKD